ncbi:MAG TPA: PDZ domain-containing protein, partial [Caldilineaceae bacterium]|nr:PDZ domain-containing protein [Caldilineaceae bacterium]
MQREPVTRSGGRLLRWFSAGVLAAALSVLSAAAVSAQTATPEPGEESDAVTATKVITKTASQTGAETGPETDGETGPKTGQAEAGVLVVAVDPGSPAAAVGLARGDIILAAGETAVNSLDALRAVLLELRPGDTLNLTYRHGDDERQAEVTLGEQEGRAYLGVQLYNAHMMRAAPAMMLSALGLELPNTAVITATLMPTAAYTSGVVVASVVAGGPAEAAGLAAGDLITELDGEPIADGEALRAALARYAPGDEVTLTVH